MAQALVQIDTGKLRGAALAGTMVYLGVPYAKPPTGELRWRAPQPPAAWAGERAALKAGADCPQFTGVEGVGANNVQPGSNEDCLYLNVYAPKAKASAEGRPVMVFLHGGSGASGSGAAYNATEMADTQDVVVVTVNYRLGPFGNLALPSMLNEDPALNQALQDQQASFKWVQRNIAQFGGNPQLVTVFGESAGAGSICHHLVSPPAKGLFQRAIMESGICYTSLTPDLTLPAAFKAGQTYAEAAGCPSGPDQLACMRKLPMETVLKAIPPSGASGGATPAGGFVVDGVMLTAQTFAQYNAGNFHRLPLMIGTNRHEGRALTAILYEMATGKPATQADYDAMLTVLAGPGAAFMKSIYSPKKYGSYENAIAALLTDSAFSCPNHAHLRAVAKHTVAYAYEFDDPTAPNMTPYVPADVKNLGAYHAAELQYLFDMGTRAQFNDQHRALSAQMMAHWARFAATGNPNGNASAHAYNTDGLAASQTGGETSEVLPSWPRFNRLTTPYRHLQSGGASGVLRFGEFQKVHQCLLWDTLNALAPKNPASVTSQASGGETDIKVMP
jgi:para-nitrobenzyl esterase